MKQIDEIKMSRTQQKSVMESFWSMIRELENQADEPKGKTLEKFAVEAYYRQWNSIMDDNKEPLWITRAKKQNQSENHEW